MNHNIEEKCVRPLTSPPLCVCTALHAWKSLKEKKEGCYFHFSPPARVVYMIFSPMIRQLCQSVGTTFDTTRSFWNPPRWSSSRELGARELAPIFTEFKEIFKWKLQKNCRWPFWDFAVVVGLRCTLSNRTGEICGKICIHIHFLC